MNLLDSARAQSATQELCPKFSANFASPRAFRNPIPNPNPRSQITHGSPINRPLSTFIELRSTPSLLPNRCLILCQNSPTRCTIRIPPTHPRQSTRFPFLAAMKSHRLIISAPSVGNYRLWSSFPFTTSCAERQFIPFTRPSASSPRRDPPIPRDLAVRIGSLPTCPAAPSLWTAK